MTTREFIAYYLVVLGVVLVVVVLVLCGMRFDHPCRVVGDTMVCRTCDSGVDCP